MPTIRRRSHKQKSDAETCRSLEEVPREGGYRAERLHTYGLGKDMTIEKELRYTEKARRGEVKEKDKE